jgi:hypothetical protein
LSRLTDTVAARKSRSKDDLPPPNSRNTSKARPENQLAPSSTTKDSQPRESESADLEPSSLAIVLQAQAALRNLETIPYDWHEAAPKLKYHPNAWLQSLDDTPKELFHKKQTKNLSLRKRIVGYIKSKDKENALQPPQWDMNNVMTEVPFRDLQFLSVFDFEQEDDEFRLVTSGQAAESSVSASSPLDGHNTSSDDDSDSDDEVYGMRTSAEVPKARPMPIGTCIDDRSQEERKKYENDYQQILFKQLNDSVRVSKMLTRHPILCVYC